MWHETIGFNDTIQGACAQKLQRDVGDFAIWRADRVATYQLAVVVDDAAQHITDIVRGTDLLDSTPRQIPLQRLLGLAQPAYADLPVVLDEDRRKLSKHTSALPVDPRGPLPFLRAALTFLGQPPPIAIGQHALLRHALRNFDLDRISRSTAAPATNAAARKDVC